MADLLKLGRDLAALEQDPTLLDDDNLEARFEALRTLDFLVEAFQLQAGNQQVATGLLRARALQGDLGQRNQDLFRKLRTGIRTGMVSPGQLRTLFGSNCRYRPDFSAYLHWGPEAADALAAGVFNSDCPPQPWDGSDSEMIHYEPTPVSALLELVDRVPLTPADRFVDIGSGLGQVALLVHLLTGVEAIGLEVMPAYVNQARLPNGQAGNCGGSVQTGGRAQRGPVRGHGLFSLFPFPGGDAADGNQAAAPRGMRAAVDDLLIRPVYRTDRSREMADPGGRGDEPCVPAGGFQKWRRKRGKMKASTRERARANAFGNRLLSKLSWAYHACPIRPNGRLPSSFRSSLQRRTWGLPCPYRSP